ncbi:SanA/YdcF family protein [Ornithinimicrobium panacihumi]|uniref:SanA/YdcF family protein n=1 Tax=Ornithinimicrobium panacihumi TaxID=2008449 RepID=UPI003F89BFD4
MPNLWVAVASSGRVVGAAEAPQRDVAIVLGAGLNASGTPSPYLAARLDVARELYDEGKVQVVLVSGANPEASYDEPTAMRAYLVAAGIPEEHVVPDFAGRDTYDTCVRARRVFGVGEQQALIVSQTYHLPRAVAICRATGLDVIGVGDETARDLSRAEWDRGVWRERAAAVKAAWDVISGRDPILGEPEPGVTNVLNG